MADPVPLLRVEVAPYYAQVELRDAASKDYPQWDSGEERAVAMPGCVAVETRPDHLGSVLLEVWVDSPPGSSAALWEVFRGPFEVSDSGVLVGSTVGASLTPVAVAQGRYDLAVLVEPPSQPRRVCFSLTSRTGEASS